MSFLRLVFNCAQKLGVLTPFHRITLFLVPVLESLGTVAGPTTQRIIRHLPVLGEHWEAGGTYVLPGVLCTNLVSWKSANSAIERFECQFSLFLILTGEQGY